MTLTEFLLTRIAEDEGWAKAARGWQTGSRHEGQPMDWSIHMDRWSPDRVLAECEAKRRALAFAEAVQDDMERLAPGFADVVVLDKVARILALAYADHPEFREEWRL